MADANNKYPLVAMDGSGNTMRAVDLVANMIGGFDYTKVLHIGQKHHVWIVN